MSARNFIAEIDPTLFREMQLDSFRADAKVPKETIRPEKIEVQKDEIFAGLIPITTLSKKHFCYRYLAERNIPAHALEDLYFTDKFYTWTSRVRPGRYKVPEVDEPRLVIPFRNQKGEITAFQGRALKGAEPKYVYLALTKDEPLIWGLDKVDIKKTIYVFEGPFDAMFMPNAIACGGGDLSSDVQQLKIPTEQFVIIYDNEPRNPHTIGKIDKAINRGFSVCIWPDSTEGKDVNEIVNKNIKYGLNSACQYAFSRINEGIRSGIEARVSLNRWNKTLSEKSQKKR